MEPTVQQVLAEHVHVHHPATAVIIEVADRFGREPHYEIEWRGDFGRSRSGQWYVTRHGAEGLALECGAKRLEFEVGSSAPA